MYEVLRMIQIILVIVLIILIGKLIYWNLPSVKRKQEAAKMGKESSSAVETEEVQTPAEVVQISENPKVSALRSAARQSLQINLLALEAQRQMAEIARLHRTDTATRRNPQSDPYYRRAEWTQDGDDWRSGQF